MSTIPDDFSIKNYIESYSGCTQLLRIIFLFDSTSRLGAQTQLSILIPLAVKVFKLGVNTSLFKKLRDRYDFSEYQLVIDNWIKDSESIVSAKKSSLESDLAVAKSSMNKEAIRQCMGDLAALMYESGNLTTAYEILLFSRDYCSTIRHSNELYLNIATIQFSFGNIAQLKDTIQDKKDFGGNLLMESKFKAARGLIELKSGHFYEAAQYFLSIDPEIGQQYNYILTSDDIALYGSICALATMNRKDLRKYLIDKNPFVNYFLILVPKVKALVNNVGMNQYKSCFQDLEIIKQRLMIDYHFHLYGKDVIEMIEDRIIIQYIEPYDAIHLSKVGETFQLSHDNIITKLAKLIERNKIQGRIDVRSMIFYRIWKNENESLIKNLENLIEMNESRMKQEILKISLNKHKFVVQFDKQSQVQANTEGGMEMDVEGEDDGDEDGMLVNQMMSSYGMRPHRGSSSSVVNEISEGKMTDADEK